MFYSHQVYSLMSTMLWSWNYDWKKVLGILNNHDHMIFWHLWKNQRMLSWYILSQFFDNLGILSVSNLFYYNSTKKTLQTPNCFCSLKFENCAAQMTLVQLYVTYYCFCISRSLQNLMANKLLLLSVTLKVTQTFPTCVLPTFLPKMAYVCTHLID